MSKVLISLPEPLLKRVDRIAKAQHLNRSQAVREALEEWLYTRERPAPKDRPGAAKALAVMDDIAGSYGAVKGGVVRQIRRSRERA